ncbi:hypothetical protein [Brevibacterium paucivorans]|uniref:hypothetical protein n=1 Tax=Brevibacterium paucivorans TaxID=170994 RepID=UPI003218E932
MAFTKSFLAGLLAFIISNLVLMIVFRLVDSWWFAVPPVLSGAVAAFVAFWTDLESRTSIWLAVALPSALMACFTIIMGVVNGIEYPLWQMAYMILANALTAAIAGGLVFLVVHLIYGESEPIEESA